MANLIGQQDDVSGATDKLMKSLLDRAVADPDNVDFALQCVQAATRWTAVKNRMNVPDEGNSFDGWRAAISGGSGVGDAVAAGTVQPTSASGTERKASTGTKKGSRSGAIGSSRLSSTTAVPTAKH